MPTETNLVIPSWPAEEEPNSDYTVTLNGQTAFVHQARVSAFPLNQVWPGYQRPLEQTEIAGFVSWDMAEPVECRISCSQQIRGVRVRPSAAAIPFKVSGNTIILSIPKPGQYTVEISGTHKALHLFANPLELDAPDEKTPDVRYFGPGVHCPGVIRMQSNETVYLAGGAVVYGVITAEKAENITIRGRGILDGSKFNRFEVHGLINPLGCVNVTIEGIILRDPNVWTVIPVVCQQVRIRNIKLIGLWRYNADGIDFVNSQHCSVEDSFLRTFDDSIVFKGLQGWAGFKCNLEPVADIQVRRCVIWNDWGRALEIGAETIATEISDLVFEDCDIIHTVHVALDIQNTDRGYCHDMLFKNIRIELDDDFTTPEMQEYAGQAYLPNPKQWIPPIIEVLVFKGFWSQDELRGKVDRIRFEDITVTSWGIPETHFRGFDEQHAVKNIVVKNLRINGQVMTAREAAGFTQNAFVHDITLSA
ncbi:MAG: glycoside hydrolase family protein [Anaerolineae bacterium]